MNCPHCERSPRISSGTSIAALILLGLMAPGCLDETVLEEPQEQFITSQEENTETNNKKQSKEDAVQEIEAPSMSLYGVPPIENPEPSNPSTTSDESVIGPSEINKIAAHLPKEIALEPTKYSPSIAMKSASAHRHDVAINQLKYKLLTEIRTALEKEQIQFPSILSTTDLKQYATEKLTLEQTKNFDKGFTVFFTQEENTEIVSLFIKENYKAKDK
jgi:hypothetical protein